MVGSVGGQKYAWGRVQGFRVRVCRFGRPGGDAVNAADLANVASEGVRDASCIRVRIGRFGRRVRWGLGAGVGDGVSGGGGPGDLSGGRVAGPGPSGVGFKVVVPAADWREVLGAGLAAGAGAVGVAVGLVVVQLTPIGWLVAGGEDACPVSRAHMVG